MTRAKKEWCRQHGLSYRAGSYYWAVIHLYERFPAGGRVAHIFSMSPRDRQGIEELRERMAGWGPVVVA